LKRPFSTAVNNHKGVETDAGSVSEGSNPSPAASLKILDLQHKKEIKVKL
jgi:hypothetical protein